MKKWTLVLISILLMFTVMVACSNPVTGIDISAPTKVVYNYGEDLDISGGKVKLTYQQGTTEEIGFDDSRVTITGYDKNVLGEQTITVEFLTFSKTFKVTVNDFVSAAEITENPTKNTYNYNENLNLAGGKIAVDFASGADSEIEMTATGVTTEGYVKTTHGTQTVTVKYLGVTAGTFSVTVNRIETGKVLVPPTKLEYTRGEVLDLTGASITVNYSDNVPSTIAIDDPLVVVEGHQPNTTGTQEITVKYDGVEVGKFEIVVAGEAADANVDITGWTYGDAPNAPVATSSTHGIDNVTFEYKIFTADDTGYSATVPTNAGIYTVRATFAAVTGFDAVSATKTFVVSPKALTADMIAEIDDQVHTGSAITPTVIVTDGSTVLVLNQDYGVEYRNNTAVGDETATATIKGRGNYTGEFEVKFSIIAAVAASISVDRTLLGTIETSTAIATDANGLVTDTFTSANYGSVDVTINSGTVTGKNVRFVVTVKNANDTAVSSAVIQLLAFDGTSWYDIVKSGWGPSTGFAIDTPDDTETIYVVGLVSGSYKVIIDLVDVDDSNAVVATTTETCTILDPITLSVDRTNLGDVYTSTAIATDANGKAASFTEANYDSVVVTLAKGDATHTNVRFVVTVTNKSDDSAAPEAIQLFAFDGTSWWNAVKAGWGTTEGFAIADASTTFYVVGVTAGTYEIKIDLVDVSGTPTVLKSIVEECVVLQAPTLSINKTGLADVYSSTAIATDANGMATASFDETNYSSVEVSLNAGEATYTNVRFVVSVKDLTSGNAAPEAIQLFAEDTSSSPSRWWNAVKAGWGTGAGFPIATASTTFYVVGVTTGTYEITISLVDVSDSNRVILSLVEELTVHTSVSTFAQLDAAIKNSNVSKIQLAANIVLDNAARLVITRSLFLDGNGFELGYAAPIAYDQGGSAYVLHVYAAPDATTTIEVTIKDITLTGGYTGLLVNGPVDVTIEGTIEVIDATEGGIEVDNEGTLTVDATLIVEEWYKLHIRVFGDNCTIVGVTDYLLFEQSGVKVYQTGAIFDTIESYTANLNTILPTLPSDYNDLLIQNKTAVDSLRTLFDDAEEFFKGDAVAFDSFIEFVFYGVTCTTINSILGGAGSTLAEKLENALNLYEGKIDTLNGALESRISSNIAEVISWFNSLAGAPNGAVTHHDVTDVDYVEAYTLITGGVEEDAQIKVAGELLTAPPADGTSTSISIGNNHHVDFNYYYITNEGDLYIATTLFAMAMMEDQTYTIEIGDFVSVAMKPLTKTLAVGEAFGKFTAFVTSSDNLSYTYTQTNGRGMFVLEILADQGGTTPLTADTKVFTKRTETKAGGEEVVSYGLTNLAQGRNSIPGYGFYALGYTTDPALFPTDGASRTWEIIIFVPNVGKITINVVGTKISETEDEARYLADLNRLLPQLPSNLDNVTLEHKDAVAELRRILDDAKITLGDVALNTLISELFGDSSFVCDNPAFNPIPTATELDNLLKQYEVIVLELGYLAELNRLLPLLPSNLANLELSDKATVVELRELFEEAETVYTTGFDALIARLMAEVECDNTAFASITTATALETLLETYEDEIVDLGYLAELNRLLPLLPSDIAELESTDEAIVIELRELFDEAEAVYGAGFDALIAKLIPLVDCDNAALKAINTAAGLENLLESYEGEFVA